jgi:hypothetical protein
VFEKVPCSPKTGADFVRGFWHNLGPKSGSSASFATMLLVMEMALKHPEVRFNKVSTSTGFEMIEKTRSSAG